MNTQDKALFGKEWIKLRRGVWIIPILIMIAVINSGLKLHSMERAHGAYLMWTTVIFKQAPFFSHLKMTLAICGFIVGFLQAGPECKGRRLRLLFHLPVAPTRIVGIFILTGVSVLTLTGAVTLFGMWGVMTWFSLPAEIIVRVLYTVAPWILASLTGYFCTVTFLAGDRRFKFAAVISYMFFSGLLLYYPYYAAFMDSIWLYTAATTLFIPLTIYSFLRFMGDK